MSITVDVTEFPELRVRCLTPRKLAIVCKHGLTPTTCADCTPTVQPTTTEVIDFLSDGCLVCGKPIVRVGKKGPLPSYCPEHNNGRHGSRNKWQTYKDRLTTANDNLAAMFLRKYKYTAFDGRTEGASSVCFTVVTGIRFDRGNKVMPIDVHVKPVEPKFNNVTPEDVEWGERQSSQYSRWAVAGDGARTAYPPSRKITEPQTNYCPTCSVTTEKVVMRLKRNYWTDKGRLLHEDVVVPERVKITTKGMYVLQGHVCSHE